MPTDPSLLRIGNRSGLQLETTPGTTSTPGQTVGGEFQIGSPSQQVGKSSQEALYGTLSEIAGNVIQGVSTAAKINRFIEDENWENFLKNEWEGPNSLRRQVLDPLNPYIDPATGQPLSDEQTYNTVRDILDKAPSRGVNSQRRSQLFGRWLEEDPDRREMFKRLSLKFNSETEKLNPNDKLSQFNRRFKYFIDAQVPETLQEQTSLTKNQLDYNTNLALAAAKINLGQYLGNFNLVLKARQQEKLGNSSFMIQVKKQLGNIDDLLVQVDRYMETPTLETLRETLDAANGDESPKTQGDVYDVYDAGLSQIEDELAQTFQSRFDEQNLEFRATYEDRLFTSSAYSLLVSGFTDIMDRAITPENLAETGLKINGLIAAGSGNGTLEQASKINSTIVGTFIEQGRRSRLDQTALIDYAVNSWKEAWSNMTPAHRRYVLQNNLLGSVINPSLSIEEQEKEIDALSKTNNLPDNLIPTVKESILYKFEQTKEYGQFVGYQLEGVEGKLPAGPYLLNNSIQINDALLEIRRQNGEGTTTFSSGLQSLFEIGLGQELYMEPSNGRLLWTYGLGLPVDEYPLWLEAIRNPNKPELQDIVKKYNVKQIDRISDQQKWINTEPSLLKRAQNQFMRTQLDKFYRELGSQFKNSDGKQREGIFTPAQRNTLSQTGNVKESQRSAIEIINSNLQVRAVTEQLVTISESIEFGNTVTLDGKTYTFSFPIPVSFKNGSTSTPLPPEILKSLITTAEAEEKRLTEQKSSVASTILTSSSRSRDILFRAAVTKALFYTEHVSKNPTLYGGTNEENFEQQMLSLDNFVTSIINTDTAFKEFFSPTSNSQSTLDIGTTPFISPNGDDNDLAKLDLTLNSNGQLEQDGRANYARLVFRVATDKYELPEIRDRFKTALSIMSEVKDGQELAGRLQDNPEHFFFIHGVVSGIIEKASRRVLNNQLATTSLDSAIQAEISALVDNTESSKYAPFLRAFALYLLKDNESTVGGVLPGNFRTKDPNESLRLVNGIAQGTAEFAKKEEATRLKGLQMWLNVALTAAVPSREQETARGPAGPGFQGTMDTQFSNPIYRIRTLFQARSPSISSMIFTDTVPTEKESREDGINIILSAYEQAGIKIRGNTPAEKFENLLINLARMNGGNKFIIGRSPDGGPETAYVTNVREVGGQFEEDWGADTGTGAEEQPMFFLSGQTTRSQNLGSTDPTNSVLLMQESLGSNYMDFLNLVVPALARQGSVSLEDLTLAWEDYRMLSGRPNTFTLVDQESVVDFTGRNEVLTGSMTTTQIPGEFEVWYHIANFTPPVDFSTRDEVEIERPAGFWPPKAWVGMNSFYRPPTTSSRLDSAVFAYLFGPRDPEQRTQAIYERDISLVLSALNQRAGRFKTNQIDPTKPENFDPKVKAKIKELAKQLAEENASFSRRLTTGEANENMGTLSNAYMFSEVKRVFFGESITDPNEAFLPGLLFDTGENDTVSQGLLAGNREVMFRIDWPSKNSTTDRTPTIKQYVQREGPVTKGNPTIDTGLPLIPELMPNYKPMLNEDKTYSFTGNSVDAINLFEDNLNAFGSLVSSYKEKKYTPKTVKGIPLPEKNPSVYTDNEWNTFYRHPWAYIRGIKQKNSSIQKVPSFIEPTPSVTQ